MKVRIFILALMAIVYQSCLKDSCSSDQLHYRYDPVYKTSDEIRNLEIKLSTSKDLVHPGKIYFYNNYLLINEINEGIHVIDNTNPSAPLKVGFISIPGNLDLAIQSNILYADNYVDLLAIDISNITAPQLKKRREEVFPAIGKDLTKGFIVGYVNSPVKLPCDAPNSFYEGDIFYSKENFAADQTRLGSSSGGTGTVPISGIGGSMARFTIAANHLYTVDNTSMRVFQVTSPENPIFVNTINLGWGIETIFPYKDKLFIGSTTGMFIFSNAIPAQPTLLSTFTHARACDPVFATDNRAYITLRQGNNCNRATDQLDVVDISDLKSPKLLRSYPMFNPKGLSVTDNTLYLCDEGLKVYDVSKDLEIDDHKLSHIKGFESFDVIHLADKKVAMVVGKDGLFQYSTSDNSNLKLLSKIPVVIK